MREYIDGCDVDALSLLLIRKKERIRKNKERIKRSQQHGTFWVAQLVKNLPVIQETLV